MVVKFWISKPGILHSKKIKSEPIIVIAHMNTTSSTG